MGFSPDWLALREPADHAARDSTLLRRAAEAAGPDPVVLDLGCGTGSTVRALTPLLAPGAQWRLVDYDSELLERAGAAAGSSVSLHRQDLQELDSLPLDGVTLITGSALIDLVSGAWLIELAKRVSVPVYFALSYDGEMRWDPEDSGDGAVTTAFNLHQQSDKGFGPALGATAAATAEEVFSNAGYTVTGAPSPWHLGAGEEALQAALVEGIASAGSEAGEAQAAAWGVRRVAAASNTTCIIGHRDFLALPPEKTRGSARAL